MNSKNIILRATSSKSYLQRALAIAALAEGQSVLENISWCDDSIIAKSIIENLGAVISESNKNLIINSQGLKFNSTNFNAGESGLSVRMFSPIFALSNKEIIFSGAGSLTKRPMQIITDALTQLGVRVKTNNESLPIKIQGPINAGKIVIDGSLSSQLLTGLLIALPLAKGNSIIEVKNLKSKPYIDMTLSIMRYFGVDVENNNYEIFKIKGNQNYKSIKYNIEGDWSSAAFFLVAGAVKEKIEISNLNINSKQADRKIITVLEKAGAKITVKDKSIIVERDELNSFKFDATDCPDLFPPIVCLASQCKGTSIIKGVSRLAHKESNRAKSLKQEFAKIGISISLENDLMYITGAKTKSGIINSHNDHRIAMAGGIMNLFCNNEIKIENKEVVNKSYPNFFEKLELLA